MLPRSRRCRLSDLGRLGGPDRLWRCSCGGGLSARMTAAAFGAYAAARVDDDPLTLFEHEALPVVVDPPDCQSDDLLDLLYNESPDHKKLVDRLDSAAASLVGRERQWLVGGGLGGGVVWHVDPFATSAFNVLLDGCKLWAFFLPYAEGAVPPGTTLMDAPDPATWFHDWAHLFRNDKDARARVGRPEGTGASGTGASGLRLARLSRGARLSSQESPRCPHPQKRCQSYVWTRDRREIASKPRSLSDGRTPFSCNDARRSRDTLKTGSRSSDPPRQARFEPPHAGLLKFVVQLPGDVVILPPGLWHTTLNLAPNCLAYTRNLVNERDARSVKRAAIAISQDDPSIGDILARLVRRRRADDGA